MKGNPIFHVWLLAGLWAGSLQGSTEWVLDHVEQVRRSFGHPQHASGLVTALTGLLGDEGADSGVTLTSELRLQRHRGMSLQSWTRTGEAAPYRWGYYRETIERHTIAGEPVMAWLRTYENHLSGGPVLVTTPFRPALAGRYETSCRRKVPDGSAEELDMRTATSTWEVALTSARMGNLPASHNGLVVTTDVYHRRVDPDCGGEGEVQVFPVTTTVGWNQVRTVPVSQDRFRVLLMTPRHVDLWVP